MANDEKRKDISQMELEGNVGRTPELMTSRAGKPFTDFSVAINFFKRDSSQPRGWADWTGWFNVVCFEDLAETVSKTVRQGARVAVKGRFTTDPYVKDGVDVFSMKVLADEVTVIEVERSGDAPAVAEKEKELLPF